MGTAEITRKRATEKRPERKDGDIFGKINERERWRLGTSTTKTERPFKSNVWNIVGERANTFGSTLGQLVKWGQLFGGPLNE